MLYPVIEFEGRAFTTSGYLAREALHIDHVDLVNKINELSEKMPEEFNLKHFKAYHDEYLIDQIGMALVADVYGLQFDADEHEQLDRDFRLMDYQLEIDGHFGELRENREPMHSDLHSSVKIEDVKDYDINIQVVQGKAVIERQHFLEVIGVDEEHLSDAEYEVHGAFSKHFTEENRLFTYDNNKVKEYFTWDMSEALLMAIGSYNTKKDFFQKAYGKFELVQSSIPEPKTVTFMDVKKGTELRVRVVD